MRVARAHGVLCRCGNEGCPEAVAAGPALQVVRLAGRDIDEVVATTVKLLNPSVVVIGGRLADAGEHLLAGIREVVYQRLLPLATQHLRFVASRAGAHAGAVGAASLAIDHALAPEAIKVACAGVA